MNISMEVLSITLQVYIFRGKPEALKINPKY